MHVRSRRALADGDGGAHVMPGREDRARPGEDHHPHRVVRLGLKEGLVELDQQSPVLRVARFRPVQRYPCDRALVEQLIGDEAEAQGCPI
jgi:hypothetical protein